MMEEVGSVSGLGIDLPCRGSRVLFLLLITDIQTKQRRLVIATVWMCDYTGKCLLGFSVTDHALDFIGMVS